MMTIVYSPKAIAADLSNGTYFVEFDMLRAENDSVSIANDYFEKPATLTINDDGQYIQFTVNHSGWLKVLQAENGDSFTDVHVISEDLENDKRIVAFKVDGDLSNPLLMKMHVLIEELEPTYDHKYSVRINLDLETMKATDAAPVVVDSSDAELTTDEKKNNKTSKIFLYGLFVVIAIIVIIIVRKISLSKKI